MKIALLLAVTMVSAGVTVSLPQTPGARFVREIAWADRGVWLKADTHIHSNLSDGQYPVATLAARAEAEGCDVIAITDHSDSDLKGAAPEYFAAIDAARRAHPKMVILAGVEWNLPPWNGSEHATVLVAPPAERRLAEFKAAFDDLDRPPHTPERAADGLRWLKANLSAGDVAPVVIYDHPSRVDDRSLGNADDVRNWRRVNDLVIGFAGAPGHQGQPPIGSYRKLEKPIDRWDPVVARVGDAWDTLLGEGIDVWGAHAPSDFHTDNPKYGADFWPGVFSETWLYAPDRTAEGVLRALRAGSFFGVHGRIARRVQLTATSSGLRRPAIAGESFSVASGSPVNVTVRLAVPAQAWGEGTNRVDRIELIAIDRTGARVVVSSAPIPATGSDEVSLTHRLSAPAGGVVVRARGYRELPDGTRLAFYTNPIRVVGRP